MEKLFLKFPYVAELMKFIEELPDCVEKYTNNASRIFEKAFEIATSLNKKEVELSTLNKTTELDYQKAARDVHEFVNSVDDIYWYCGKALENDDCSTESTLLSRIFETISNYIAKAMEAYSRAVKSLESVQKDSVIAEGKCKELARDAQIKKHTTRFVGGTVSAAVIGAGVVGVVAAAATLAAGVTGVGTVVGLGLTAAGSAATGTAVGTGTAVVTHVVASDYKESEENFRSLGCDFKQLYTDSAKIMDILCGCSRELGTASRAIDMARDTPREHEELCKQVRIRIQEKCRQYHEKTTSVCRDTLKKVVHNL